MRVLRLHDSHEEPLSSHILLHFAAAVHAHDGLSSPQGATAAGAGADADADDDQ